LETGEGMAEVAPGIPVALISGYDLPLELPDVLDVKIDCPHR
jgi:hypothetical protein